MIVDIVAEVKGPDLEWHRVEGWAPVYLRADNPSPGGTLCIFSGPEPEVHNSGTLACMTEVHVRDAQERGASEWRFASGQWRRLYIGQPRRVLPDGA